LVPSIDGHLYARIYLGMNKYLYKLFPRVAWHV